MNENESIEFKENYTEKIYKEIIAFLNTNSGTIYIGIENKYGYEYKLERTTCYDEKGEIISINE